MTSSASPARPHLGILGTGVMGEAVLAGALRSGVPALTVAVSARRKERAEELTARYGVAVRPAADVAAAEVVVLAVKPTQAEGLLAEVAGAVRADTVVLSVMAGVGTAQVEAALAAGVAVVRAMPNTPVRIGAGVTALCAGSSASPAQLELVAELLKGTGDVVTVQESAMDAVTGLSGSGPAYVFAVIDALAEGGVHAGLPRALAHRLALGTVAGAARLATESGQHPAVLREQVTSPAGTTAAGLRELDERGLRSALVAAVLASARRAGELR